MSELVANVPIEQYVVVRGDTLTKIAQKFDTSVAKLTKLNGIPNAKIPSADVIPVNIRLMYQRGVR